MRTPPRSGGRTIMSPAHTPASTGGSPWERAARTGTPKSGGGRPAHRRVRAAHPEDTEPGQEVEVPLAGVVVEVAAAAGLPTAVKPDGADYPGRLRVEVARPQRRPLAGAGSQGAG